MANDLNRLSIIGRLTKNPELRYTPSGTPEARFDIANNRKYKKVNGKIIDLTSFFTCVAWGQLGLLINESFKKGQRIGIDGKIQQRFYEDLEENRKKIFEIVVEDVQEFTDEQAAATKEKPFAQKFSDLTKASDFDEQNMLFADQKRK